MKDFNRFPTTHIPVIVTHNTVFFPQTRSSFLVRRRSSAKAVAQALTQSSAQDRWVLLVAPQTEMSLKDAIDAKDLARVGTLARIETAKGDEVQGFQVVVHGEARFRITDFAKEGEALTANGEVQPDHEHESVETTRALVDSVKSVASDIFKLLPSDYATLAARINEMEDAEALSHLCAQLIEAPLREKQHLLEMTDFKDRVLRLLDLLVKRREELKLQSDIGHKISEKMGKVQREAMLREQLRAIQSELNGTEDENDAGGGGKQTFAERIEASKMSADAKKVAKREAERLEALGEQSPESHVIRNYLETLLSLPWGTRESADIDLQIARDTLEREHFGLDEVKKKIIQHLAVMKLKKDQGKDQEKIQKGSILLLVGPPGIGKTSLGQSIADALQRKFIRVALGGVRDEADIRGHRRTYIGAMPGRMIDAIKRAGENNPVFLLDEIDKVSRGWAGDPTSALLEALDPEQNHTFTDHYLDIPYDLSNVTFIATANSLETIPAPLLDRMDVIMLSGYSQNEKMHIAERHLLPKQLKEHGLTEEQVKITGEALRKIIAEYTREAGVRDLQRKIAAVLRSSVEKVLAPKTSTDAKLPVVVEAADLEKALGRSRFNTSMVEQLMPPGVVTGLAWTPVGGDILFIESTSMPGTGKLTVTGQLGDVMKESITIAMSLVRSHLAAHMPHFEVDKQDIHVHVPAGGIPKDGPSAGITMVTALASLLTKLPVSPKLAMTGEITLRGAVLPVGGIKEKVTAAHRAGIRSVIMSRKNEPDLTDLPEEVSKDMKVHLVESIDEVLKIALGLAPVLPNLMLQATPIDVKPAASA